MYDFGEQVRVEFREGVDRVERAKDIYEMYYDIFDNVMSEFKRQRCFVRMIALRGVCGDSWNMMLVLDIMEKEVGQIEMAYKSDVASDYDIYVPNKNSFVKLDQYDFMTLMFEIVDREMEKCAEEE